MTAAERAAYKAGAIKAQSVTPGRPRVDAARYPTAAERSAYLAGWHSAR